MNAEDIVAIILASTIGLITVLFAIVAILPETLERNSNKKERRR